MDTAFTQRQIEHMLEMFDFTHEQRTRLLYDVLLAYASKTKQDLLETVCTHIIPWLVTFIQHDTLGLRLVEQGFERFPVHQPAFTAADRDAIMHVFYGTHRQAVRHLLTAVSGGVTDAELCDALKHCLQKKNIPEPAEKDRYSEFVTADTRRADIERFLSFRRDVPPSAHMNVLWDICMHIQNQNKQENKQTVFFERICMLCINSYLIPLIAQLPDAVARVEKEAQKLNHQHQHQRQPSPQPPPPQESPTWQEVLEHFDANKDGKISVIEAIKALKKPEYKKDAIRLGFEPGEFTQEAQNKANFSRTFVEIDIDGDKYIDEDELRLRFLKYKPPQTR
jgi:Ca2+-binding EF-hand superfamily protein